MQVGGIKEERFIDSYSCPISTHIVVSVQYLTFPPAGCWSERTEVHRAASLGQVSRLQDLIKSGASVNIVAVDSITPLHEACIRGQAQCVQLLLEAGAQVSHFIHYTYSTIQLRP